MFAELQRVRFLTNQTDAAGHDGPLPPRKQGAVDLVKVGAAKLTSRWVILNDPRYPKVGASVLTLSDKRNVLSNIAQDYGGKGSMQDVLCAARRQCASTGCHVYTTLLMRRKRD